MWSQYIAPLRLVTVISIWADALYAVVCRDSLTLPIKLFMLIHLVLAISILLECRRSEIYYRLHNGPARRKVKTKK